MAKITISDLNLAASDLFMDSESFLNDLTESELDGTNGGVLPVLAIWGVKIASGYVIGAFGAGVVAATIWG